MKRIYSLTKIKNFSDLYFRASGFKVPIEYLATSQVYVCEQDGRYVGGFVVGKSNEYKRTLEVFVSDENKNSMYLMSEDTIEVCCFWMDKNFRSNKMASIFCWIRMCWIITWQKEKQIIWGTNNISLAKVYDLPARSHCVHIDEQAGKRSYVFMAATNYFLLGVGSVIKNKLLGNINSKKRIVTYNKR